MRGSVAGPLDTLPVWVPQHVAVRPGTHSWQIEANAAVLNRKAYRRTTDEIVKIEPTDWLVVDDDGVYLYDDRTFKARYEKIPAPPEDGGL